MILAVEVPPLVSALAVLLIGAAAVSYLCTRIGLVPIVGFVVAGAHRRSQCPLPGVESRADRADRRDRRDLPALRHRAGAQRRPTAGARLVVARGRSDHRSCSPGHWSLASAWPSASTSATPCSPAASCRSARPRSSSSSCRAGARPPRRWARSRSSFLIFQDLAVVVMVLLLPMLAPGGAGGLGDIVGALVKSAVVIVFVLAGTRWFIPRALDKVAENSLRRGLPALGGGIRPDRRLHRQRCSV